MGNGQTKEEAYAVVLQEQLGLELGLGMER